MRSLSDFRSYKGIPLDLRLFTNDPLPLGCDYDDRFPGIFRMPASPSAQIVSRRFERGSSTSGLCSGNFYGNPCFKARLYIGKSLSDKKFKRICSAGTSCISVCAEPDHHTVCIQRVRTRKQARTHSGSFNCRTCIWSSSTEEPYLLCRRIPRCYFDAEF